MRTFVNMFVVQSRHNSLTDLDKTWKMYSLSWLEIAYLNRGRTKLLYKFSNESRKIYMIPLIMFYSTGVVEETQAWGSDVHEITDSFGRVDL